MMNMYKDYGVIYYKDIAIKLCEEFLLEERNLFYLESEDCFQDEFCFPIIVRKNTIDNSDLLKMLFKASSEMLIILIKNNVFLKKGALKIWIKESKDNYYPKIEFSNNKEELQYDINLDGTINEVHFKTFKKVDGIYKRRDIAKEYADKKLQIIDNFIRYE